jgi:hypothetical protein
VLNFTTKKLADVVIVDVPVILFMVNDNNLLNFEKEKVHFKPVPTL